MIDLHGLALITSGHSKKSCTTCDELRKVTREIRINNELKTSKLELSLASPPRIIELHEGHKTQVIVKNSAIRMTLKL